MSKLRIILKYIFAQMLSMESCVFDVSFENLLKLQKDPTQTHVASDLIVVQNTQTLLKFIDVCKKLNIDPMGVSAVHLCMICMCKNKNVKSIADKYARRMKCESVTMAVQEIEFESIDDTIYKCIELLNSMRDWNTLFTYLQLNIDANLQEKLQLDPVMKHMTEAMLECGITSPAHSPSQLAVLAFVHMSPRGTPSGKMLESLFIQVNPAATDVELKCLRAMTQFKDDINYDDMYCEAMVLVMQCFTVQNDFCNMIQTILAQKKENNSTDSVVSAKKSLKRAATEGARIRKQSEHAFDWDLWRHKADFPVTMPSQTKQLLYFICVQTKSTSPEVFVHLYPKNTLQKIDQITINLIDKNIIFQVIDSVRICHTKIVHLIDFRQKCLEGLNEKKRQSLSQAEILQLYIACFQHSSIWEECWKRIVPTLNFTIRSSCAAFRENFPYEVDKVVQNLIQCLLVTPD